MFKLLPKNLNSSMTSNSPGELSLTYIVLGLLVLVPVVCELRILWHG